MKVIVPSLINKQQKRFEVTSIKIMKFLMQKAFVFAFCIAASQTVKAQTNTWDGSTSVNWNTGSNWSLGIVPTSAHDVVIPNNFNVTVNTAAVCKTLTISGGNQPNTITVGTNSITVSGAISIGAGTGNGDDKIITISTGFVTCTGLTITAIGGTNRSSGITVSSTGTVTVSGSITMGDANDIITYTGAGFLRIGNTMSGGTFTAGTGTVQYYGDGTGGTSSNQTVATYSYYNLATQGNGTKTLAANTTIANSLNVGSGTTLDLSTFTANRTTSGTGPLTVAGTLLVGGASNFPTNYTTMTMTGGTVNYDATTGGQTIASGPSYNILTLSNTSNTQTAGGALTATTLNTTAGGTLNMVTNTLTVTNVSNAGIIRTQNTGATPISAGKTWGGTIQYDGAGQTVVSGNYATLTLSGSGTKTYAAAIPVSGALSIAAGVTANLGSFTSSANTLSLGGNGTTSGSFGSTASSATYQNNTFFTAASTGIINVAAASCSISITLGTIAAVCQTASSFSIPYTATTGGANTYSLSGTGITSVTNGALPASPVSGSFVTTGTPPSNSFTISVGNSITGCVSSNVNSSVTVNASPTAGGTGSQTICSNGTAVVSGITASNGTISWTENGAGNITANGTTVTPTYTAAAGDAGNTVTLTMTVTNSPCAVAQATYTVNVNAQPQISAVTGNTVCSGGIGQLTITTSAGTGPFSVVYTGGSESGVTSGTPFNVTPNPTVTTAYTISSITDNNGCVRTTGFTASSASVTINANGTWIGITTDWFTPSNWCGGAIPTAATNVVIPSGGAQPTINASGAVCNNLTINLGATLTLGASGEISVAGTFTKTGTLTANATSIFDYSQASGTQTLVANNYGNLVLSGGGTKTFPGGTIGIAGTFTPNGFTTASAGTIDFNGSGTQTIPAFNYNNLTSSSTGARTLASSGTIAIAGTFTGGTNVYTVTGSTVSFTSAGAQTIPALVAAATNSYNNLSISGAGTKTCGGAFSIGGNLTISAGTLSLNNTTNARTYTISGNYSQSGGVTDFCTSTGQTTINIAGNVGQTAGNFDASGGSAPNGILNFNGTGVQTLSYATPANNEFVKYTIANGATLRLLSNLNIRRSTTANFQGSVIVSTGGTLNTGTFVISQVNGTAGSAIFTLSAGAKLITANTGGIASAVVTTNITDTYTAGALYEFNSSVANQSTGFTGLTIGNPASITISNTFGTVTADANVTFGNTATLNINAGATLVAAAARTFTFGTGGVVNIDGTLQTANTTATGALFGSATSTIVGTNSPTINIDNSTSVIEFNGAAAQAINSRNYGGIKISNGNVVNMGGTVTVNATLNLNTGDININGNSLVLNGPVTRTSGNIRGSVTSNLTANGTTGSLFFNNTGTNNYLKTFTIGASGSATLGNALNIAAYDGVSSEGVLTVTPGGTLTTGGFLAIKSNANGTARIAEGSTSGGYISGDVSVERYIPQNSSKGWRLLASNTSGQTINQAWQEGAVGGMVNPNPGFGTKISVGGGITTNLATAQSLGFDTLSPGASMFRYNATTDVLQQVSATNTGNIASEPGYFLFIRGDRSPGQFGAGAPTTATVLRSKGSLFLGDQSAVATGASNYALVRNPYPSAIDMRNIVRGSNIIDAYQVWDSKLGGTFGVGGFQTFSKSGANYVVSPGGGSYGSNGSVQNFIESGAAFYIQSTTNTNNTVQVTEACKASGSTNNSYRPSGILADDKRISFTLYALNPGSNDVVDGGLVFFNDIYSNSVTVEDVRKSGNFNENFGILRDNTDLVVEKRKDVATTDSIFFKMYQLRQLSYRIDLEGLNFDAAATTAILQDKFTNSNTTVNLAGLTSYTFTVSATAGSFATDRFRLVLAQSSNTFTGTGNWTDNARWSKGVPPTSGENITIAAGANASLNTDFSVSGSLTMETTSALVINPGKTLSVSGTADFAGQSVTFKSDATGYGSLGQVTGTLNGATNFTVERYIPDNGFRSWRLLSVPTFGNGQTIRQAWQEGNANPSPLQNNLPNRGTQITGVFTTQAAATAAGFDSTSVQASMLTWNGTGWSNVNNTNQPISNYKAYFLYIRGDRSKGVTGAVNNSSATTLRTNGTVYTGNQVFSVPTNGFAVVANTYPSAINFTGLTRNNVNNLFYTWDSKKQNGSSLGVYQTFSAINSFNCLISGGSYTLGQPNTIIESGQAFFVTGGANAGGGSVTLLESAKVSGTSGNLGFRPSAVPAKIDSRLLDANNEVLDANVIVFDKAYSKEVDSDDAVKFGNPGANFAIENNSKILAIEGTQPVAENDVIQFRMWNLKQQNYTLQFAAANLNVQGLYAVLEDKYLNSSKEIDLRNTNAVSFSVNGDPASSAANRFRILFSKTKPVTAIEQGYSITPNPVEGKTINLLFKNKPAGIYNVKVVSAEGKLITTKVINYAGGSANQSISLPSGVTTGNYQVEITTPGKDKTVKQIFVKSVR